MVKGSPREGSNGRSQGQENLSATTAGAHLLEVFQDGFAGLLREGVFLCSAWFGTRDGEDLTVPIQILQAHFADFASAQPVGC